MEKVLMQENRQDAGSADALLSVPDKALVSAMEQRGYLAVQGGSSFPARDINKALTAIRGVTRYEDRDTLLGLGYTDEMLCYYGIPPETGMTENPFCGELYFDGWKYSQVCDFLSDFLDSPPAVSFGSGCDVSIEGDATRRRLKASFRCYSTDMGSLSGCLRRALKKASAGVSGLIMTPDGIIDIENGKAACLPGKGPEEVPGCVFAEDDLLERTLRDRGYHIYRSDGYPFGMDRLETILGNVAKYESGYAASGKVLHGYGFTDRMLRHYGWKADTA